MRGGLKSAGMNRMSYYLFRKLGPVELRAWAVSRTAHAPVDYADAVGATAGGVATGVISAGAGLPFLLFRWFGRPNKVA